jgi:hypothetical protein
MTPTVPIALPTQRLLALERANEIRRARAQLKQHLAAGRLSAAQVILDCPLEASSWPVAQLLASQPGWGSAKCGTFLARNQISEVKAIGELTERQRQLLAARLGHSGPTRNQPGKPAG